MPNNLADRAEAGIEFCDYCGRRQAEAIRNGSTHCAPPHIKQPHRYTGKHPADQRRIARSQADGR